LFVAVNRPRFVLNIQIFRNLVNFRHFLPIFDEFWPFLAISERFWAFFRVFTAMR